MIKPLNVGTHQSILGSSSIKETRETTQSKSVEKSSESRASIIANAIADGSYKVDLSKTAKAVASSLL